MGASLSRMLQILQKGLAPFQLYQPCWGRGHYSRSVVGKNRQDLNVGTTGTLYQYRKSIMANGIIRGVSTCTVSHIYRFSGQLDNLPSSTFQIDIDVCSDTYGQPSHDCKSF